MNILITGFEPFQGEKCNPSCEVLNYLPEQIDHARLYFLTVPVVFRTSLAKIEQAMKQIQPDVVLSLGQAGGLAQISLERIGINLDDARIADNEGAQPFEQPIDPKGPAAYFATLPLKAIQEGLRQQNIPAVISNTAGTFVCNHVLYGVRALCERVYPQVRSGFIHLPYLPQQTLDRPGTPSMSMEDMVRAMVTVIQVLVRELSKPEI